MAACPATPITATTTARTRRALHTTIMDLMATSTMGMNITTITMIMGMARESPTSSAACPAIRTMATTMPDGRTALLRLMAWLSPAFPVGSFSYSHGLEKAVEDGLVEGAASLQAWIADLVEHGSAWNDAVLFAEAHRRAIQGGDVIELAELGEALAGSRERHMETMLQGAAFTAASTPWQAGERLPANMSYPVAVGATAGAHGIAVGIATAAYLQAFVSNQLQAAIRLSVIGQTQATAMLAALEPLVAATASRAAQSSLDDLGSATVMAEIAAMRHETQQTRLFRS